MISPIYEGNTNDDCTLCVKKTFLSHLYENVANHDFDRFRPRKLFVKISSICYQKRKWNIKHKRFIEQSISYHIGWSILRSKVLKIAFFSYFTIHIKKFLLDIFHHFDKDIKDQNSVEKKMFIKNQMRLD